MGSITTWAPLAFGIMMGWISAYYIRKDREYEYKDFWKIAGVFLAGVGLSSWEFIISLELGVHCILHYMLGHPLGFFLHRACLFALTLLSDKKAPPRE